jgi:ribonuclease T2
LTGPARRRRLAGVLTAAAVALAPAAAPAQGAPESMGPSAPGRFDFYVLALSWSPGFCDTPAGARATDQCAAGKGLGFVVHGLWPQFDHGYPADCDPSRPAPGAALREAEGVFPSEGLARHEWLKHGTCTGLGPAEYFASARRARDSIVIPDALKAPGAAQTVAPIDLERAFAAANPGLRPAAMAVGCAQGELQEIRICLSRDLRQFVNCPEVAQARCRAESLAVPPVR